MFKEEKNPVSKRRREYERGLARFLEYLDIFLRRQTLPDRYDIRLEIESIPSLRKLNIEYSFEPPEEEEGFFFLLKEDYERYDDVIPSNIEITTQPLSMAEVDNLEKHISRQKPA